MTVVDWLQNKGFLNRLVELIVVNEGSMEVKSVGNVRKSDNRFGRVGLVPSEALELTYYRGVFDGLCQAHQNAELVQQAQEIIQRAISGISIEVPTPDQVKELLKPVVRKIH